MANYILNAGGAFLESRGEQETMLPAADNLELASNVNTAICNDWGGGGVGLVRTKKKILLKR